MPRQPLPQRRRQVTVTVDWHGTMLDVSIGFDDGGRPREVFVAGAKTGSDMRHVLEDSAVIVSLALQHGCEPDALAKSIAREPDEAPASALGLVIDVLCDATIGGASE